LVYEAECELRKFNTESIEYTSRKVQLKGISEVLIECFKVILGNGGKKELACTLVSEIVEIFKIPEAADQPDLVLLAHTVYKNYCTIRNSWKLLHALHQFFHGGEIEVSWMYEVTRTEEDGPDVI